MPRAPDRSGTSEAHASTAPPGALPHALVARLAALLFFLGGLIGLVVDLAVDGPGPGAIQTALGPAAMATGAVAWFCPWERWPRLATFWPVPVALALIATGATFGGLDPHAYGAFFTLIFTWLGMTQPRWTSLRFAVPAAVFYAIPFLAGGRPASELISVAQVIPICALVGEAVAWVADRLRRREEELRDALRVKSDFLTMTSHELRTPLVPVLGFASSMLSKWDVAKEQEKLDYLHRIDRNARVLDRMVENLIAMSSMEVGGGSLPEVVDVGEIIQRTLGEFREEGHIIDITCPPGIGVVADRDHLRLVLSNFVANALRYGAPPFEIAVQVDADWANIAVADGGEGVRQEFVPHLFEKFTREGLPGTQAGRGLGLGLPLARALALVQGGEAWYEPNEPRGSRFGVRLRRADVDLGARSEQATRRSA